MKKPNPFILLLVAVGLFQIRAVAANNGHAHMPRGVPEAEGVSSPAILAFLQDAATNHHEFHSFMLVRHGKVVAEGWWNPYRPDLKHTLYSVSKSFTSTAVGFAVTEKRLSVDDKVISFFPEWQAAAPTNHYLTELKVKDLLTMSVGQEPDPTGKINQTANWEQGFLETPILYQPGSRFLYNSMATYMLSAIVTKVTGQKVMDYLKPRLFDPLDIAGFDWETNPAGRNTGGWGLRLKTEDLAKFGQLLLQDGVWNSKQVLSKEWVAEATTNHILQSPDATQEQRDKSDWLQGYGYKFWRCRNHAFRADGAFGQYIIVMPEQDAVIAITSETKDMQGILNMVWKYLLPAMHDGQLPRDKAGMAALQQRLKSLALPVPTGGPATTQQATVSGRSYSISPNDRNLKHLSFQFKASRCAVTFDYGSQTYRIPFGSGNWVVSETKRPGPSLTARAHNSLKGLPPFKVAAAYAWKDDHTLELTLRYVESPHTETIRATFSDDHLSLELKYSLDPSRPLVLEGSWRSN